MVKCSYMMDFIAKYWIEVIFGAFLAIGGLAMKKIKGEVKEFTATQNGVKSLLRDKIIDRYDKYQELDKIPFYAKESIMNLYDDYKALGGNGSIDDIMKEIRQMEVIMGIPHKEKIKGV